MTTKPHDDLPWGTFAPRGWRRAWLSLLHALPAGAAWRRLALLLRKPLKSTLPDPVDISVWGLRLRLRPRGNLSEQRLILMPQFLDRKERDILTKELKQGGVFLDIGANIGVFSYWVAASCGPQVRVEAFEPDPALGKRLRKNIAINSSELAGLRLHSCALGASEGEAVLRAGEGNAGENRIEHVKDDKDTGFRVPMLTLPTFLARENITRIDALKIDVEGHEVAVLEPLFLTTARATWPRLLVCEIVKDGNSRLDRLLAKHGYHLACRGRLNGIYRLAA